MENFLIVAEQVGVLFALMAFGAAMRRARLLNDASLGGLVNLLILVVTPCLIVDVFQRPFSPAMLKSLALAFGLAVACHLALIFLARLTVRHRDEDVRRPLLLAAVFSNAGFMGIPLEQALIGDVGVFYGISYVAVFNLFIWSWGYQAMKRDEPAGAGRSSFFTLRSLVNPGTVGLALGLPLFLLSFRLPDALRTTVHLMAGLNTPLAMIVIGYCLWGAQLGRVVRMPAVYAATALRLVVFPLLLVACLYPFRAHLDRNMALAVSIAAAAPVAAMVSMFATKFGRDVDTAVAVVSGSTLLSIVTLPLVIALAMSVL